MLKWLLATCFYLAVVGFCGEKAGAIPLFARQYGVTCEKCHSVIPHLNAFGAAFLAYGYRIPGVRPGPAFPISAKINLVDSSEHQGSGPGGLPKAIVDEIETFTAGAIGSRASYLVEQYVVDGGEPGLTRDAWITDRVNPWSARIAVYAQAGQFTLPLPVDPETFRDTYADYSVYTQTVGGNPFDFFEPKLGVRLGIGDPLHGASIELFTGPGYDRQSGLRPAGLDTMEYVQDALGAFDVGFYHYAGTRPMGGGYDEFYRDGYSLTYGQWTRFSSELVLQNGWDSNCGAGLARGCASSGGFEQLRYALGDRLYTEVRYEGTDDPTSGFARDLVVLAGYAPTEFSRVTIEDVVGQAGRGTNTLNAQFTAAR